MVAYYFTVGTISTSYLKSIITNAILQLQTIGVTVKATVCDQGPTQKKAISELCAENTIDPTPYTFVINNITIVTIFDVPHLLKCTRNALLHKTLFYIKLDSGLIRKQNFNTYDRFLI